MTEKKGQGNKKPRSKKLDTISRKLIKQLDAVIWKQAGIPGKPRGEFVGIAEGSFGDIPIFRTKPIGKKGKTRKRKGA